MRRAGTTRRGQGRQQAGRDVDEHAGLAERGILPDEQQIEDDLTGIEYSYDADNAILLEKKEHMKARGLPRPTMAMRWR
jgi:hypothetical protein